jgi:hypothetical protein
MSNEEPTLSQGISGEEPMLGCDYMSVQERTFFEILDIWRDLYERAITSKGIIMDGQRWVISRLEFDALKEAGFIVEDDI